MLSVPGAFLGGLVAGYLARRIDAPTGAAGFRAGLIGWLPALLVGTEPLRTRAEIGLVVVGVAAVTTAVLLVVGAFIGAFGARFGGWLAQYRGHPRDLP